MEHHVTGKRLYNNIYLLQLGCYPVAVVILHVNKTWNWLLLNLSREGYMRSMFSYPIAWWDYRMMVQIRIANEELGSSNLFTEQTRPHFDSETACNVFYSLMWGFITPRMQVTSVCRSRCEICCFVSECDVFQESRPFLCFVQHVYVKTLCQSVRLLDVITVFTWGT